MLTKNKLTGTAVAVAAAGLILSGCATKSMDDSSMQMADSSVHCSGVNACKGQSACKSASNDCKGKNSCKGHGWLKTSKSDCEAKGGMIM